VIINQLHRFLVGPVLADIVKATQRSIVYPYLRDSDAPSPTDGADRKRCRAGKKDVNVDRFV
jgi:hypothetical protein